jgi:hypothetical protein
MDKLRLPNFFVRWVTGKCQDIIWSRKPDFIIGGEENPYLKRWYAIPRNRFFNIYIHEMWRSDDDRALHDHPWWWCSLILRSYYYEQRILAGGIREERLYERGSIRFYRSRYAHRLVMPREGRTKPMTLFITGPKLREWGFHCLKGWVSWQRFTNPATNGATIGRGCD